MNCYEYKDQAFDSYKTSLQLIVAKKLAAKMKIEQNIELLGNVLCRAYLEQDEDAEKLLNSSGLYDMDVYAWLDMDKELYEEIQRERIS